MTLFEELRWRGLMYDSTASVEEYVGKNTITGYIGFDPTSTSLQVGNLLAIMGLVHLQRHGHTPIAIAGGGTGMIGDPGGKTQERQLLSLQQVEENLQGIKEQLKHFLDFEAKTNKAMIINNADWLAPCSMLEFLRDVGKYFTVNYMLTKESVKTRLDRAREDQEQGISFTEFSYMLLQAYDFLVLYDRHHCTLQMGGSDQWGNITAGIDLIRKLRGESVHGIVFPLVTDSSGVKFGKTESGTIWLDPQRTSPYRFYQFWFNSDDSDVIRYTKYFTLLSQEEIAELEVATQAKPEERTAQRRLAREVTLMVHGQTALEKAEQASRVLFGGEISDLDERDVLDIFADVPSSEILKSTLDGEGRPLIDVLVSTTLASSKGDARRLIQSGGIYFNNRRVTDVAQKASLEQSIAGKFFVLRKGAKTYHLVRMVEE
jgi:tyrosyl-tRNA synthetase